MRIAQQEIYYEELIQFWDEFQKKKIREKSPIISSQVNELELGRIQKYLFSGVQPQRELLEKYMKDCLFLMFTTTVSSQRKFL